MVGVLLASTWSLEMKSLKYVVFFNRKTFFFFFSPPFKIIKVTLHLTFKNQSRCMDRWKAAGEALGKPCGLPDGPEAPGCWDLQSPGLQPCLAGGFSPLDSGCPPHPSLWCCPFLLFLTALPGYWGAGGSAPVAASPTCAKVMAAVSLSPWQVVLMAGTTWAVRNEGGEAWPSFSWPQLRLFSWQI